MLRQVQALQADVEAGSPTGSLFGEMIGDALAAYLASGAAPAVEDSWQYLLRQRLERAKQLLRDPSISLSQVSVLCGFADQSHLTNVFRRFVGVTPSKYRSLA